MHVGFLVAALVAAASAVGVLELADGPFWRRWDRPWTYFRVARLVGPLMLLGILVAAVASAADVSVGTHLLDGVLAGAVAYAFFRLPVLRVDGAQTGFAGRMFARSMPAVEHSLMRAAEANIAAQIGDLTPDGLCMVHLQLFKRHIAPQLKVQARAAHIEWVHDIYRCARDTGAPPGSERETLATEALATLSYECERRIIDYRDSTIHLPVDEDVPGAS
jgi:hypothetical protein